MKLHIKILLLLLISIHNIKSVDFVQPGEKNFPYLQDFQKLRLALKGDLQIRGEEEYHPFTYNTRTNTPKPAAIAIPEHEGDVVQAFRFAKLFNLRVSIQSTGHHQDIRNIADNSMLIDMRLMKDMTVDLEEKTVTLQTGNVYGEIHEKVSLESNHTLVVMSGADASVGPYGFTTGGGHGRLNRQFGLGCDALLNIRILLSNGTVVNANQEENQDLFWAMRGSGGHAYGITLEMKFQLFDAPGKVQELSTDFMANDETATVFAEWMKNIPNTAGAYYTPVNIPKAHIKIAAYCFGDGEECDEVFAPLMNLCMEQNMEHNECDHRKYFDTYWDYVHQLQIDKGPAKTYLVSTALNAENLETGLQKVNEFFRNHYFETSGFLKCAGNSLLGGKAAEMDPDGEFTSVARAMRTSLMVLTCYAVNIEGHSVTIDEQIKIMDSYSENILEKYGTDRWVYWNEPNHNFKNDTDWKVRYWGSMDKYNRLLAIKQKYDSENFFQCYHCIGWNESPKVDPALCPQQGCSCSNTNEGKCADTDPIQRHKVEKIPISTNANIIQVNYCVLLVILILFLHY